MSSRIQGAIMEDGRIARKDEADEATRCLNFPGWMLLGLPVCRAPGRSGIGSVSWLDFSSDVVTHVAEA